MEGVDGVIWLRIWPSRGSSKHGNEPADFI